MFQDKPSVSLASHARTYQRRQHGWHRRTAAPIRRCLLIGTIATLVGVTTLETLSAPAGQATPAGRTECTVPPVPESELAAMARATPGIAYSTVRGTPVATPAPPTGGSPASTEVISAVTATVHELLACFNAGDRSRIFALYSENYRINFWGGLGAGVTDAELDAAISDLATPMPLPAADEITLLAIEDVQELPDGRISAVVRLSTGGSLSVFVPSDGRYLLDWAYPLSESATPTP